MSRKLKLMRGSFVSVTGLGIQIAISFFMMPFLISSFGESDYGLWSLVATFMGYYGLLDLGFSSAVSRFVARTIGSSNLEERKRITSTSFYIFLILGVFAFLATILFTMFAGFFVKDPEQLQLFRFILIIMGATVSSSFPFKMFFGVLSSNLRHDLSRGLNIIQSIVNTVLIVYVVKSGYGVLGVAIVTASTSFIFSFALVFLAYHVEKSMSIKPRYFKMEQVRSLFGYGVFSFIGKVANMLKYSVDNFVIARFVGLAGVTHYAVALRLVEYFISFITSALGLTSPLYSQEEGKNDFDSILSKFLLTTKISNFIAFFAGIMILLYAKLFLQRWMGPAFADSYYLLVILMIPAIFGMCQIQIFNVLYAISRHRVVAAISVFEGVTNLIGSLILVRRYGLYGVALGTLIPMLITTLIMYPLYLCKVLNYSPLKYYGSLLANLSICTGILLVIWMPIRQWIRPEYGSMFMLAFIHSILFWGIAFFLGLKKEQRKYLIATVKARYEKRSHT